MEVYVEVDTIKIPSFVATCHKHVRKRKLQARERKPMQLIPFRSV